MRQASELVEGYRTGALSPVEATQEALDAIERYDEQVNAFVLVDPEGALAAVRDGRIAATLDVFDNELLPRDHPLWDAPNVTVTAHMSGDVIGWRDTLAAQFATNVRRWLAGEPLLNIVDKKLGYIPTGDR